MAIERFEEIKAWQAARELTNAIYTLTRGVAFKQDLGLRGQMQRAAVSVMANIAEGFDRRSRKEFAHFLQIALASATEVKSHLYVALDQSYLTQDRFDAIYEQCSHTSKLILGFMNYLTDAKAVARSRS